MSIRSAPLTAFMASGFSRQTSTRALGVAAGLGQLVHAALKDCYIGAAGGNLGCIGVGVKVGVFQRTETAQKDCPAAVQQL